MSQNIPLQQSNPPHVVWNTYIPNQPSHNMIYNNPNRPNQYVQTPPQNRDRINSGSHVYPRQNFPNNNFQGTKSQSQSQQSSHLPHFSNSFNQVPQIYNVNNPQISHKPAYSPSSNHASQHNPSNHSIRSSTIPAYNQQSIEQIYERKKTDYVNRIRRLQDHIQINYPDKGKYIGQVLQIPSNSLSQRPRTSDLNSTTSNGITTLRHGQGIFFYPTGDIYFGGWKQQMFQGQGVYMFRTGQIYDGLLKNSRKDGTGTYYYQSNLSFYSGTWQNDLKHGSGLLNSTQQYYQGQWKNGLRHGNGYYKNKINKTIYIGQFYENKKHGKGRIVYSDGSTYAGEFVNQLPQGVGDFEYPNKDKYIGQFIEGKKHGKGNYFFSQGTIFSGLWKQDSKIQGQLTLFNGDIFNGCFRENQRYQGTYRYRNGDVYQGTWKNDVKQGYGKLYLQNGQKYQGKFIQGHKHGQGIYTWKNGDRYEGNFVYDKRQGLGEYFWNDGGYYKGEWKAQRMNGYGRLVKDGVDIIGDFFADHFQRPIQQNQLGQLKSFILS